MTETTNVEQARQTPTYDAATGERYRRELFAHCYRMTGSVHEAEDLVQETYLRAWRAREGFRGGSSVRTWLHRIATNTCLTALEGTARRPLPTGLGAPASDPVGPLDLRPEVPWLEPVPDSMVGVGSASRADAQDAGDLAVDRASIRLAFVAALQFLTPPQRAALLLREVLALRASEIAESLGTSEAAVNSLLQRARAELARVHPEAEELTEPDSAPARELLARYVRAFESYDAKAMIEAFTSDTVWEMPPYVGWYRGAQQIIDLIKTHCPARGPGDMRLVPTQANGQPAFGLYMRGEDGVHRAFHLHVLTLSQDGERLSADGERASADGERAAAVSHVSVFFGDRLFQAFGLPEVLD